MNHAGSDDWRGKKIVIDFSDEQSVVCTYGSEDVFHANNEEIAMNCGEKILL